MSHVAPSMALSFSKVDASGPRSLIQSRNFQKNAQMTAGFIIPLNSPAF
jgi:hypothetical protein